MEIFRTYTCHKKGIMSLVTWTQRRCEKCKRFLSKHQQKYCSKCAPEKHKVDSMERNRKYYKDSEFLIKEKLRHKVYWNAEKFNIGDSI
jgi:hypothetical protein